MPGDLLATNSWMPCCGCLLLGLLFTHFGYINFCLFLAESLLKYIFYLLLLMFALLNNELFSVSYTPICASQRFSCVCVGEEDWACPWFGPIIIRKFSHNKYSYRGHYSHCLKYMHVGLWCQIPSGITLKYVLIFSESHIFPFRSYQKLQKDDVLLHCFFFYLLCYFEVCYPKASNPSDWITLMFKHFELFDRSYINSFCSFWQTVMVCRYHPLLMQYLGTL